MSEFQEVFKKAQKELSRDQFYFWLCEAYGAMSISVGDRRFKKKTVLEALEESIENVKKTEPSKYCIFCGKEIKERKA